MPRETVQLGLSNLFALEPGATFLSFLAYPNFKDATTRGEFFLAICRFAITAICEKDRGWADSPQIIKPGVSLIGDTDRRRALRLGSTQLSYRFKAAVFFAWPHLYAASHERELVRFHGYVPTVKHLATLGQDRMGWDRGGDGAWTSTIKTRIWGSSRPVVHAAAILWADGARENPDSWLPYLKEPELLEPILLASEEARLRLLRIKQFRIKEAETVQFLA